MHELAIAMRALMWLTLTVGILSVVTALCGKTKS
jgi:hypothetical protein